MSKRAFVVRVEDGSRRYIGENEQGILEMGSLHNAAHFPNRIEAEDFRRYVERRQPTVKGRLKVVRA